VNIVRGDNDLEVTCILEMAEAVLARRARRTRRPARACWASRTRGATGLLAHKGLRVPSARLARWDLLGLQDPQGDWGCWPARIYGCRWPGWPTGA